jgi:hypothetical protein
MAIESLLLGIPGGDYQAFKRCMLLAIAGNETRQTMTPLTFGFRELPLVLEAS